jgi:hypothetical protein
LGLLTDDWASVFPYEGGGVFSYEVYSFDYHTTDFGHLSGEADLNALPTGPNPFPNRRSRRFVALPASGEGEMLWIFPNNSAGDQAQIVDVRVPRWFEFPW